MDRKGDREGNDYDFLPPVQPSGDICIASFFKLPGILLLF